MQEATMKNLSQRTIRTVSFLVFGLFLATGALHAQSNSALNSVALQAPGGKQEGKSFDVKVSGRGQAMILIPGLSSSGETWDTTVAHYQSQYTCHVLTLAGFAGVPPIHAPLLSTVTEDLAAYIQAQHLQKPIIIGHSLGGNVAMALAARHPDLVGPVVIVDSLPFFAGAWFQVKSVEDARPMIASMHAYMSAMTPQQYQDGVRSGAQTKYMVTDPANLQVLIRWGLASDQATVADAMAELVGADLRPGLAQITSPTLLLGTWVGLKAQLAEGHIEVTRASIIEEFQKQFANLPHLHFVMSDTARHFIMFDDPKWFFAQLDTFLADPVAAGKDRGFAAN
jgi:N-formylmaleamate deformylase